MLTYVFSSRISQATEQGGLALALAREAGDREQLAFVLNDLGQLHMNKANSRRPMMYYAKRVSCGGPWIISPCWPITSAPKPRHITMPGITMLRWNSVNRRC